MRSATQEQRADTTQFESIQSKNQAWWTRNTMSYDWKDRVPAERFSSEWFDEIDHRFIHSSRLFATRERPFDRIIPFDQIGGKSVLEIGCGMGLHTELMTRAGASVCSIDLSPTSVDATRRRLALRGLTAEVAHADAELIPYPDQHFDFVWSWGVIHHSSRTAKIVREIARVLRPHGAARIMVYNRDGMAAKLAFIRNHVLRGGMFRWSFDQSLHQSTDGFSARHYVRDQIEDLFRAFFSDVSSTICGQESDAIPLPAFVRKPLVHIVSESWMRRKQSVRGSFLFVEARNPF